MYRKGFLAAVLLGLCMPTDAADDGVVVGGTRFPRAITSQISGKPVKMVLTGTAMRTRWTFHVYAIGSYVQEGAKIRDAGDLARAAVPKQLHIAFARDVDAPTLARSFRDAIATNYPAPAFADELATLQRTIESHPIKEGDHIWMTSLPGVGLVCQVVGGPAVTIRNVAFAQAVWEIYLGRKNLGTAIKTGLTSRL